MYVPGITNNLLSVVQSVKDNAMLNQITSSCCLVKDRVKQEVLLRGTLLNVTVFLYLQNTLLCLAK